MNRKAVAQWLKGKKINSIGLYEEKNIPSSNPPLIPISRREKYIDTT